MSMQLWSARSAATAAAAMVCVVASAQTRVFEIPAGELKPALDAYVSVTGQQLIYRSDDVRGLRTKGVSGSLSDDKALEALLEGTGLRPRRDSSTAVVLITSGGGAGGTRNAEPQEIEVITVTAQKRPEASQSVPIAITTFSARSLEENRIESLKDVSRLTPGLLVSAFSQNSPTIAIRGANNTFQQLGVSKPVAVMIDDVFVSRNSAASFELFDLDSVAVLKGPQGTLFGRNVTGGVVTITTRKPNLGKTESEAQLGVGNFGERELQALMNLPLDCDAAVKISTSLRTRDGYGQDRLTGREQDNLDSKLFRAQYRLLRSDATELLLSADYGRDGSDGRTLSSSSLGDDGNRRTSELGVVQGFQRAIWGLSGRLIWDSGFGEFTSISGFRRSSSSEGYSGVGANFSFLTAGSQALVTDTDRVGTFSQELRYASPLHSAGDFVAGLYLSYEDGKRRLGNEGLAARTGALVSSVLVEQNVRTTTYAAFADGTLRPSPSLDLIAGVRFTRDKKAASLQRNDLVRPTNSFSATGDRSWNEVTPRLAVNWRPAPDVLTYLSVTRGFTAGGYNTDASSLRNFETPFDPETVTNTEIGVKSQWLKNRLRFNLSAFEMKYKDKQEFVNNTVTGILSIVNASAATIRGAEMEFAYRPLSWLGVALNYAHLDASYDRFEVGTINNTGNSLASSPKTSYSVGLDWSVPLAQSGAVIGTLNYAHLSTYNTGAANDPNLQIPAYGLANASLGFETRDRRWRIVAWTKNFSDTKFILTRSTQVVRAEYLGPPRTFGLSIKGRF